jgi:hypothetical protein
MVCVLYVVVTPILMAVSSGFSIEALSWEIAAALLVTVPVAVFFRLRRADLTNAKIALRVITISVLIIVSQIFARIFSPDVVLDAPISDRMPGPEALVLAAATASYALQHLFLWLLLTVLVSSSVNYRSSKKEQRKLSDDIARALGDSHTESSLTQKQRDAVKEMSRRVDAIEKSLGDESGDHVAELVDAVRALREDVVRPSLKQLNALLAQARSEPGFLPAMESTTTTVPWRWGGMFFSGTVGALLIGITGLLLAAPAAYYLPGLFIQLGLIMLAFFVSVPAALLLFSAAALTPVLDPTAQSTGGAAVLVLIGLLGAISFLQRFNRVRQVRAVESMSVTSAYLALNQVRRAQELKVIEERVNSILHGSVQSTLLALELGLQSRDESVIKHSADAISHLRSAISRLDEPVTSPVNHFELALDNILSVWAGSVKVTVRISPESAGTLNADPLAASAAIEVVKEGTQNAVKHSDSREVTVSISQDGDRIRVAVSHLSMGQSPLNPSGHGIRYLRAITSSLRLSDDGITTTLSAEIPFRQPAPESLVTPG